MRKLLAKIFIKDYLNYDDPNVRTKYGTLSGTVGIVTNLLLCIIKILTGFFAGSISIIADGINNLSDAGSSIITLVGFKMASKPADKDHPFGHERLEYVTGLIISFIIIFIGLSLLKTSIEKIFEPDEINVMPYTYIILSISILIKLWQGFFYKTNGKLINSQALIATSSDSFNDCITTFGVLISMAVVSLFSVNLDSYMGILVSLFILYSGIKLVKETVSPLLGEAPSKEFVIMVDNKIRSYEGVLGLHDLVVHSYGPGKNFLSVHVEVDANNSILDSHDLVDNIESDFRKDNIELVVHMDPIDTTNELTIYYKEVINKILNDIDKDLMFHDFRTVLGSTHTNLLFDVVIPIGYKKDVNLLTKEVQSKIDELGKNLYCVITYDFNYIGE